MLPFIRRFFLFLFDIGPIIIIISPSLELSMRSLDSFKGAVNSTYILNRTRGVAILRSDNIKILIILEAFNLHVNKAYLNVVYVFIIRDVNVKLNIADGLGLDIKIRLRFDNLGDVRIRLRFDNRSDVRRYGTVIYTFVGTIL